MLALHLLQPALVHDNTLLMQRVLDEPARAGSLAAVDRRALPPLYRPTGGEGDERGAHAERQFGQAVW